MTKKKEMLKEQRFYYRNGQKLNYEELLEYYKAKKELEDWNSKVIETARNQIWPPVGVKSFKMKSS